MDDMNLIQLAVQWPNQRLRQRSASIFSAFAVAYRYLQTFKVDVLYPQTHRLHQAQPRTVKQRGENIVDSVKLGQESMHLHRSQYHRKARRLFGPCHSIEPREFDAQNNPVEKQNRSQGLILCRRRNIVCQRQVGKKSFNLRSPYLSRVAFPVKEDKTTDSIDATPFRTDAVMFNPAALAHLVKKTWFGGLFHKPGVSMVVWPVCLSRLYNKQYITATQEFYQTKVSCYNRTLLRWNYS